MEVQPEKQGRYEHFNQKLITFFPLAINQHLTKFFRI